MALHAYGSDQLAVPTSNKLFEDWVVRGSRMFVGGGSQHMRNIVFRRVDIENRNTPLALSYGWTGCNDCVVENSRLIVTAGAGDPAIANRPDGTHGLPTGGRYVNNIYSTDGPFMSYAPVGATISGNVQGTQPLPGSSTPTPTPTPDTTAPTAPTNLNGSASSATQINLTWSASTDNVGVVQYRIYRNGTQVGTSSNTQHTDTGLTAGTSYIYTVRAVDIADNQSAQSSTRLITTQAAPTPTVTIDFNSDGRVDGLDITILATSLFVAGPKTRQQGDLSGDGFVTALDLSLFSTEFCRVNGTGQ
jgi:hypothetical protein